MYREGITGILRRACSKPSTARPMARPSAIAAERARVALSLSSAWMLSATALRAAQHRRTSHAPTHPSRRHRGIARFHCKRFQTP